MSSVNWRADYTLTTAAFSALASLAVATAMLSGAAGGISGRRVQAAGLARSGLLHSCGGVGLRSPANLSLPPSPSKPVEKSTVSAPGEVEKLRPLFDAIRKVESGGKIRAVGDNGRSLGPYQISRGYWEDACRYGRLNWPYKKWVWDPQRCEKVMRMYWRRYGATTDQQRARMHNGGPGAEKDPRTLRYWRKVQRAMQGP